MIHQTSSRSPGAVLGYFIVSQFLTPPFFFFLEVTFLKKKGISAGKSQKRQCLPEEACFPPCALPCAGGL